MPKFITPRDVTFFKSIAREVVDVVVENVIHLYKINLADTKVNIYGESLNKTWHPPVQMNALINKEAQSANYEGFGSDVLQTIEFRLDRFMLEEINVYPEICDIISFNEQYYEIDNTSEIQFAGGQPYNNFSVVCNTFAVSRATLNIEQRIN